MKYKSYFLGGKIGGKIINLSSAEIAQSVVNGNLPVSNNYFQFFT